ncbi:hypothetical protein C0580_00445 [Candidatus Parcubacteria bacterium]|nr:MAG: hypothetical protein C0580_00445 [Candidatus Parcubacteria bacterium]
MEIRKDVISLDSGKPGKITTIVAGIHGNEICGMKAFAKLIPNIKIIAGKVNFVYGNLRAIEKNVREIDVNLNRLFRPDDELTETEKSSYEYSRSQKLKKLFDQSDALLDIHSSRNENSVPFAIVAKQSFDIAQKMPFKIKSSGWDIVEPGGTDDYMNRQNKINICAECGYNLDPESIKRAQDIIKIFLKLMGNIDEDIKLYNGEQKLIHAYYIYHTKTNNFKLNKKFKDFEFIKKDTLIGIDGEEKIVASEDSYIIFALNKNQIGVEAFILGKKCLSEEK